MCITLKRRWDRRSKPPPKHYPAVVICYNQLHLIHLLNSPDLVQIVLFSYIIKKTGKGARRVSWQSLLRHKPNTFFKVFVPLVNKIYLKPFPFTLSAKWSVYNIIKVSRGWERPSRTLESLPAMCTSFENPSIWFVSPLFQVT